MSCTRLAVSIAEKEMRQIKWEERQQEVRECELVSAQCLEFTIHSHASLYMQRRWQKQQNALVSVANRARGLGLVLKRGDAARFKAAGFVLGLTLRQRLVV